MTPEQIAAFKKGDEQLTLGLAHENYGHMAVLSRAARAELAKDFD